MKRCINCGHDNSDEGKFCVRCGTRFAAPEPEPVCEVCGGELPQGVKFCIYCGAPVQQFESTARERFAGI